MCRKELTIWLRAFASALRGEVAASPSQHGPEHVIVLVPNHVRSLRLQGPHHQGPVVDAFGHGDAKRIVGVLRVDAEILGIVRLLVPPLYLIDGVPQVNKDGTPKMKRKTNPEYDATLEESYLPRDKRQEWACVGLLGQLYIRKECIKSPYWRKIKDVDDVKEFWFISTVLPDQAEKAKVASLEARISALENN